MPEYGKAGAAVKQHELVTPPGAYGRFGVVYSTSF